MAGIYDERCCEMLKLEAGECDCLANSWGRAADPVASVQVDSFQESLHGRWVLLIEVLEDHESFETNIGMLDRLEKIPVT